jgi:hypothetical protein
LSEIKTKTINSLESFKEANNNDFVHSKIDMVLEKINQLEVTDVNDDLVSKYLTVSKLKEEIQNG